MLKVSITVFLGITFFVFACRKKEIGGDLSGNEYIRGRLFLQDPLSGSFLTTPLAKKTLFISYAGTNDTLNYLFSDTTDAEGYFLFQNLTKDRKYRLFYQETIGGIIYSAIDSVTAPRNELAMTAQLSSTAQNGIWASVKDPNGAHVNNASIYLYQSNLSGYPLNSPEGNNYQATTDALGHTYKLNVQPHTYYVLALATLNGIPYIARDTIEIGKHIVFDTLQLSPPNGVNFSTVDIDGAIIPNVNICMFTSKVLFDLGKCEGSNFPLNSGPGGKVSKYNLPKINYFVLGVLELTKDTLVGQVSFTPGDVIFNQPIILQKK